MVVALQKRFEFVGVVYVVDDEYNATGTGDLTDDKFLSVGRLLAGSFSLDADELAADA